MQKSPYSYTINLIKTLKASAMDTGESSTGAQKRANPNHSNDPPDPPSSPTTGGRKAPASAGVLRRPKLRVSPDTIYSDPAIGKFAQSTNVPGAAISRPTVHYVGIPDTPCELLNRVNTQIGAVLTMTPSSGLLMGKVITVSFRDNKTSPRLWRSL